MDTYRGIQRIGGKSALVNVLIPILEYVAREYKSNLFIDACMGGMKIIGNINNTLFKDGMIGNDLDSGIANLASVFGDKEKVIRLYNKMEELLKYVKNGKIKPEKFFYDARTFLINYNRENRTEELDFLSAFLTVYVSYTHLYSTDGCFDKDHFMKNLFMARPHKKFLSYVSIFSKITVMNEDCFDLFEKYKDNSDVLFYIDPPYDQEAMKSKNHYKYNFNDDMQKKLVDILSANDFKAKFVLSGWDNDNYNKLTDNGIYKYYIYNTIVRIGGRAGKKNPLKPEYIWSNVLVPEKVGNNRLRKDSRKLKAELRENEEKMKSEERND